MEGLDKNSEKTQEEMGDLIFASLLCGNCGMK
jgi:hypothetical protein